jgi:serine/threonine protein kinase/integral membrane sensor domain MASE1
MGLADSRHWAKVVLIALVYLALGRLGLSLALPPGKATAGWLPSGLALAVVLQWGYQLWPGILVGAFAVNFWDFFQAANGSPLAAHAAVSMIIGVGSAAQALLGAFLLNYWSVPGRLLQRLEDFLKFAAIAPVMCLTACSCGVTGLVTLGFISWPEYIANWWTWWLGDVAGVLVGTPFILVWLRERRPQLGYGGYAEAVLVLVLLASSGLIVLGGWGPIGAANYPLVFLFEALLVWSAVRLGRHGAATATLVASLLAVAGTIFGAGPFVGRTLYESLLFLQSFTAINSVVALALAVVLFDQRRAEEELRSLNEERSAAGERWAKELSEHKQLETDVLKSLEKYAEEPAAQEDGTVPMEPLQPLTVVVCDELSLADNAEAQPAPVHETDFSFLGPSQGSGFLFRLEHYQVIKLIGKGSNGMVFEAFDEMLRRIVAVKILKPKLASSERARAFFMREARAMASIRNDNVIDVYAVDQTQGIPYLVMEFIAGTSLAQKHKAARPMELEDILQIGHEIACGLQAAHSQGLIHRDIKPSNILLEGPINRVKITDFGIAVAGNDVGLRELGLVWGTPHFMSPEQAHGKVLDHRSDLFSLGSVFYYMCTGQLPFQAESVRAVLRQVCEATPRPMRDLNPHLPGWLIELVARLQTRDPAQRFQSAAEVANPGSWSLEWKRIALRPEHVEPPRSPIDGSRSTFGKCPTGRFSFGSSKVFQRYAPLSELSEPLCQTDLLQSQFQHLGPCALGTLPGG